MSINSRIRKTIWTIASGLLVLALTAAAFVAAPATPAYADDGTPPSGERSRDRGALLEQGLRAREGLAGAAGRQPGQGRRRGRQAGGADREGQGQRRRYQRPRSGAGAVQGPDWPSAEHAHDEAAAILDAHAGFNGGGKVTDAAQALETVKSAGSALREAAQVMVGAAKDLQGGRQGLARGAPAPAAAVPDGA